MLRAQRQREERRDEERVHLAWYTAKLVRAKLLPSLTTLLHPEREAPPLEQLRADHAALLAAAENN
jgi:hypothetical protein